MYYAACHALGLRCAPPPPASYSEVLVQALPPLEAGSPFGPRGRNRLLIIAAESTLQGIN